MNGVVFLGTPHHGAGLARLLQRVLKAAFNKQLPFITELQPYCDDTERVFENFNKLFPVTDRTISFHESMGMGLFNEVCSRSCPLTIQVVVPKASAKMGHEKCVALNGNHLQITKFKSSSDDNFRSVSGNLRRLIEDVCGEEKHSLEVQQECEPLIDLWS